MDAVSGFLTKYGAVPAGEAGPAWGRATAQALATHLGRLAEARQANRHRPADDPAIAGLVADLGAVAREVWRRVGQVLVAATVKGVCFMAFADERAQALADLAAEYPDRKSVV